MRRSRFGLETTCSSDRGSNVVKSQIKSTYIGRLALLQTTERTADHRGALAVEIVHEGRETLTYDSLFFLIGFHVALKGVFSGVVGEASPSVR